MKWNGRGRVVTRYLDNEIARTARCLFGDCARMATWFISGGLLILCLELFRRLSMIGLILSSGLVPMV